MELSEVLIMEGLKDYGVTKYGAILFFMNSTVLII